MGTVSYPHLSEPLSAAEVLRNKSPLHLRQKEIRIIPFAKSQTIFIHRFCAGVSSQFSITVFSVQKSSPHVPLGSCQWCLLTPAYLLALGVRLAAYLLALIVRLAPDKCILKSTVGTPKRTYPSSLAGSLVALAMKQLLHHGLLRLFHKYIKSVTMHLDSTCLIPALTVNNSAPLLHAPDVVVQLHQIDAPIRNCAWWLQISEKIDLLQVQRGQS